MGSNRSNEVYWPRLNQEKKRYARNHFFLGGKLHKVLQESKVNNRTLAWSYPDRRSVTYITSDLKKDMEHAFTLSDLSELLGRSKFYLRDLFRFKIIPEPQVAYWLTGKGTRPGTKMFSESDVLALHDYFSQQHRGRPRKDGFVKPQRLPTKQALIAAMRQQEVFYVKNKNGEFVPVWDQGVFE